jgi:hypothetical protein
MDKPEVLRYWTSLYYGSRGSGKTLHQARDLVMVLRYYDALYSKFPGLHRAIVVTNQKLNAELETLYLGRELFYFDDNDLDTLKFCPRPVCWRGPGKHKLHACLLVVDDISNILGATDWATVPKWLKKMLIKGRKFSIHLLTSCIDPFDQPIQFRRCTDICYKFRAGMKTPDPDETMPPLKHVFGLYHRRKISAEMLYKYGDLPEQIIRLKIADREQLHEDLQEAGRAADIVYSDDWIGATYMFNRSGKFLGFKISSTETYDTLQDVSSLD